MRNINKTTRHGNNEIKKKWEKGNENLSPKQSIERSESKLNSTHHFNILYNIFKHFRSYAVFRLRLPISLSPFQRFPFVLFFFFFFFLLSHFISQFVLYSSSFICLLICFFYLILTFLPILIPLP